jgi:hypothetical protein
VITVKPTRRALNPFITSVPAVSHGTHSISVIAFGAIVVEVLKNRRETGRLREQNGFEFIAFYNLAICLLRSDTGPSKPGVAGSSPAGRASSAQHSDAGTEQKIWEILKPYVSGTRMDVATIVGLIAAGETVETVAAEYQLSIEQVRAALAYAAHVAAHLPPAVRQAS